MTTLVLDRVKETTQTEGPGPLVLLGAEPGFQGFDAFADGDAVYYVVAARTPGQWEVGTGTVLVGGTLLDRTSVLSSSNAGALVDLAAGLKDVFVDRPAAWNPATSPGGSPTEIQFHGAGGDFEGSGLLYDETAEPAVRLYNAQGDGTFGFDEAGNAVVDNVPFAGDVFSDEAPRDGTPCTAAVRYYGATSGACVWVINGFSTVPIAWNASAATAQAALEAADPTLVGYLSCPDPPFDACTLNIPASYPLPITLTLGANTLAGGSQAADVYDGGGGAFGTAGDARPRNTTWWNGDDEWVYRNIGTFNAPQWFKLGSVTDPLHAAINGNGKGITDIGYILVRPLSAGGSGAYFDEINIVGQDATLGVGLLSGAADPSAGGGYSPNYVRGSLYAHNPDTNDALEGSFWLKRLASDQDSWSRFLVATKTARATAQAAAVASLLAYTVTGVDSSFDVSANVNVTTATTHNFTVTCAYTDETNTARTLTLGFTQLSGATFLTAITNVTGAGPYESPVYHIRCKAGTTITFATVGVFTAVAYNVEAILRQTA